MRISDWNSDVCSVDLVDPFAAGFFVYHINEILVLVVDRMIGAEVLAGLHFFGAAGGREDGAAKGLGELDRRGADSRGAAVHQEAIGRASCRDRVCPYV